jgi:putative aminopeptidase FrvX
MSKYQDLTSTLNRALTIQDELGTRAAATFLRDNKVSMCIALYMLARKPNKAESKSQR